MIYADKPLRDEIEIFLVKRGFDLGEVCANQDKLVRYLFNIESFSVVLEIERINWSDGTSKNYLWLEICAGFVPRGKESNVLRSATDRLFSCLYPVRIHLIEDQGETLLTLDCRIESRAIQDWYIVDLIESCGALAAEISKLCELERVRANVLAS